MDPDKNFLSDLHSINKFQIVRLSNFKKKKTKNFLEATGKGPLIKHTKYDKSLFMQTFEQELGTRNIIRVNASTVKSKY